MKTSITKLVAATTVATFMVGGTAFSTEYSSSPHYITDCNKNIECGIISTGHIYANYSHDEHQYTDEETFLHLSIDKQIGFVIDAFGLSVTTMALILNVSRPTVYSYLDGGNISNEDNINRLEKLYLFATYWNELTSSKKLGMELKRNYSGVTLLSLLTNNESNEEQVKSQLIEIAKVINSRENKTTGSNKAKIHISSEITRKTII